MNIRRSIATVGAAGALATGSYFLASPAQAAGPGPVVTGGLVNVTIVDAVDIEDVEVTVLENVAVGVAANVQAQVCGTQVGANVLTILSAVAQGQETTCENDAGNQSVTVEQA
jgi:hypothetical protein